MAHFEIRPYRLDGGWVFDDPLTGLREEGLVRGADDLIERVVAGLGGRDDLRIEFADAPFDGAHLTLEWLRPGEEPELGTWYRCPEMGNAEAWLCESLRLYFGEPPARLHLRATTTS